MPNNPITILSLIPRKVEHFYIFLLVNNFKLSKYVVDSGALDNVMPLKVANALGLTMTKTFSNYYSVENRQVPLVEKIKDAQFAFEILSEEKY